MIQILTVKNPEDRAMLCQKAGLIDKEEYHIIAVHEGDGVLGQGAIFRYQDDPGEILWLDMGNDIELADGLSRAILSILEIRGIKKVTLPLEYEQLAEKLKLKRGTDCFVANLDRFFCRGCQHK